MQPKYDVIIVGAGPAGIFAALELAAKTPLRVLMLEKGADIEARRCPMQQTGVCAHCPVCSIVSGWGGAGAFSDGKLTLTTAFGGWLDEYMDRAEVARLIKQVDDVYLRFGAPTTVFGTDEERIKEIQRQAAQADLSLIPARIRHLGTEKCFTILKDMRAYLGERVDIRPRTAVRRLLVEDGTVRGVETEQGETIHARYVIVAPGREGAEWFAEEATRLGLKTEVNPVDIGVRVEVPAVVLERLTDVIYESKFIFFSKAFDDRVRTFCMNPYGAVVLENNGGLFTVNGHSYAEKRTENTNFAVLVSKTFTEPFREPISYGKYIARLANLLGGGVLVQRLGDFLSGRRTTPERLRRGMVEPTLKAATPGDLSLVLPYRHLVSIIEMLKALDVVAPGIFSRHTLLYGVEVKFYSSRLELTHELETGIRNLFAAGDGAGITRGLAQASACGVVCAGAISRREGELRD
ncbi:MAG TPA: NAD(P)/FAD-dependent oxidoreductase [Firmicutes bacterium]|nr:NAD(P)/FAD-dependent oxidoreductase [Bacillota bacterium]